MADTPHQGGRRSVAAEVVRLHDRLADPQTRRTAALSDTLATRGLSERRERFAQAVAKGATQADAAREAGYTGTNKSLWETGSKLARDAKVAARIAALKAVQIEGVKETRQAHLARLHQLEQMAREQGNIPAAIRAIELRGKLMGFYVKRKQTEDITERARKLPVEEQERLLVHAYKRMMQTMPDLAAKIRDAARQTIDATPAPAEPTTTDAAETADEGA